MTNGRWALALLVGIAVTVAVRAPGQGSSNAWELATVMQDQTWTENGVPFYSVRVCYHIADGCRMESLRIKSTLSPDMPLHQLAVGLAGGSARLAEAGWEPVAMERATTTRGETLLMKRRKQ